MSASIPVIGLSTSDFVPGVYTQLGFAAGSSGGTSNPINLLLLGNATAASYVTTNSLFDGYVFGPDEPGNYVCSTEDDVKSLFGAGSELHRMYRQAVKVNAGTTPIYFVAVKESTGSNASLTVTFAVTATGNGYIRTYIGDEFIDTPVVSGDLPATVATNVSAQINSNDYWAVTSSPASSTVVITAKQKGLRGNSIRVAAQCVGSFGTTSSAQNFTYLAGGTTADVWTNTLATILPRHFRYIATAGESAVPSGDFGLLTAQLATQALPINGNRQVAIGGHTGTIGNANTAATNLNSAYARLIWEKNSNYTPAENAAFTAGMVCLAESSSVPLFNFDYLGQSTDTAALWSRSAPFDGTTVTRADVASALVNGVSPVVRRKIGAQSTLVSLLTTYCKNPITAALDTRTRDHHIVTVMFIAADRIESMLSESFSNRTAANDPPEGQKPPASQVVTPSVVKAAINKVIYDLFQDGFIQNVQASLDATQVVRETVPSSRFGCLVQLYPISLTHQFTVKLQQLV